MRLNPAKCSFGVTTGKFLGFMGKKLKWDEQSELAFQTLKEYLARLPILVKPLIGEELQLYLAVLKATTSGALVKECNDWVQRSVYYVSHAFTKYKKNYTLIEKLDYALAKGDNMVAYLAKVREALTGFKGAKHAVVAIDYFTHWVEAKALVQITKEKTTSFVKENIVYRFSTPMAIITDMGKHFDNTNFKKFYEDQNIDLRFASVSHPQTNGLVEATNKTIKKLLKKSSNRRKDYGPKNYPMCFGHTGHRTATGETFYSFVFGTEAVLPIEHKLISFGVQNYKSKDNKTKLRANLDILEEKQYRIVERVAMYQSKIA
ncbi:hypothetical protein QYF36_021378 [Acer negundo]|nr:hypothetical protein QYF36_021378 [Acer negundo]